MAEYKIELGVQLKVDDIISQINEAERKVDPITIKVDAETKELTKSIQDALKTLSGGTKNALTLDTSKFEGSIADIKSAVIDLKKVLGSLDDSANMKSLLASVNQIANAIGKVTDESETLAKSLSILSKKDFGFNFNLKTGNANPIKAATDYGIEARRKAIPAMQEQVAFLQDIIGGTEKADKALERYLVKQNKGFGGVREKERLQREMLGGVDLDGKSVSISKQMGAYEQTISILKKIAVESGKSLDGFDARFSKAAENIVDDTVKIQTGVKQTEEALESAANEMKQIFSMGVGADQLSAQLEPIVSDLNQIREAVQNLSKGVSLDGLTASFDRLSGAIENLLANAEKVKGVLNSGFDGGKVGTDIKTTKPSTTTPRKTKNEADKYLNEQLERWNIKGEDAKTVRGKFKAFSEVSSLGAGNELYDTALDDLMSTLRQVGKVYKEADQDAKEVLSVLKSYKIEATKDVYGAEFSDDWKHTKQKYKILRNDANYSVDDAYQELGDPEKGFPWLFPDSIGNEADQLKKIIDVYDDLSERSKDRYVSLDDEYGRRGLENEVLDIVNTMQEQVEAEQKVAQTSTQSANTVTQSQEQIRQEYEKTKRLRDEADRQIEEYNQKFNDIEDEDGFVDLDKYQEDFTKWQELENYRDSLTTQMQSLQTQLQAEEQQARQTAEAVDQLGNSYEKISRDTSLTRDATPGADFQKTFESSSQAAQEAQRHFQELLADEKAVVSVTEQFDDNNALQSFVVNIRRASGEVETLRYAMDKLNDEGDEGFVYQGGSTSDGRVEKQLEARIKKANDLQTKLDKIRSGYKDANASKPIKDDEHIKALDVQYRKVEKAIIAVRNADDSTFSSMIANAEKEKSVLESMIREYRNAENVATSLRSKDINTVKDTYASKLDVLVSKMKSSGVYTDGFEKGAENLRSVLSDATDASGLVKFLNGLDKLEAGYKRADAAAKEFNRSQKVGINTSGLESKIADLQRISPEIDKFETEIDGAKVSVKSLIDDLQQVKTQGDFSVVNARFKAFKEAASAAGIAVTEVAQKAKSINDIKIKISDTGFNGFEQEVARAHIAAEELEGSYDELEAALKRLDIAMEAVYSADQAGDVKRLVAANEEYEAALKQVYSQLKLNQQFEQKAYKAEMLNQKKSALSSEMKTWLKENSRAAKDFGDEIRRLDASLDGLDAKGVKLVGQQFKAITKQAQAMGRTGLTAFDKLKTKAKEYMTYLSAAEMFMYAEQAFRSMFEQVKLIDSAMTELKKVTDETESSYNKFLSNAASRSKELGTTIDGLVSSTADFARLGYGFEDAQGLAEVANVYAVVGDEIEGVEGATESLISTMAAFKDSATGMSNSDFAMSIIDKFNEIGNNFAISSGGIGEALERSASSLMAANATLDESVALITASNQVVQDPVAVGE